VGGKTLGERKKTEKTFPEQSETPGEKITRRKTEKDVPPPRATGIKRGATNLKGEEKENRNLKKGVQKELEYDPQKKAFDQTGHSIVSPWGKREKRKKKNMSRLDREGRATIKGIEESTPT